MDQRKKLQMVLEIPWIKLKEKHNILKLVGYGLNSIYREWQIEPKYAKRKK